ncbi:MAG TPA: hypothetical protein PKU96_00715 [bacterium]|mgnify:CR=1 FL=1|jgi:hypothetical protein|nr:hypothetical protein [Myxococcales bacterium]OQA61942.1 MAG: hypothetical protein BWY40_00340 [bacterium ADurb.Bin270]HPW44878.1 hypothetical protein [bacterium]HQC50217.1 hypothetical protein [bacterium]HQG14042.1 hypothetical protein [bacterium]
MKKLIIRKASNPFYFHSRLHLRELIGLRASNPHQFSMADTAAETSTRTLRDKIVDAIENALTEISLLIDGRKNLFQNSPRWFELKL